AVPVEIRRDNLISSFKSLATICGENFRSAQNRIAGHKRSRVAHFTRSTLSQLRASEPACSRKPALCQSKLQTGPPHVNGRVARKPSVLDLSSMPARTHLELSNFSKSSLGGSDRQRLQEYS